MGQYFGGMAAAVDVLQIAAPATGATVVADNATTILLVNNSSLLLALIVTLPQNPLDLQKFTVAANAAITALTVNGGTVKGALSSLSLSGFMTLRYSAALGIWFRTA